MPLLRLILYIFASFSILLTLLLLLTLFSDCPLSPCQQEIEFIARQNQKHVSKTIDFQITYMYILSNNRIRSTNDDNVTLVTFVTAANLHECVCPNSLLTKLTLYHFTTNVTFTVSFPLKLCHVF